MILSRDNLVTLTLLACALTTTGLAAYRALSTAPDRSEAVVEKPVFVQNWRTQASKGIQLGPSDARVQIIEFADFECPFCASFHHTLKTLRNKYPETISVSYVHFPLPMHRFAEPAARAAECAAEQGRFEAMHDRMFEYQSELGLRSWTEFARQADVPDLAQFGSCMENTQPVPQIATGRQLGDELDIRATPTVIINGWKLARPPTSTELDDMVKAILAGREPVSAQTG